MAELAIEINTLAHALEKSAFQIVLDYALTIVPIIVSIIAVGISIFLASRQTKIDLFDERYCVFHIVNCIQTFLVNFPKLRDKSSSSVYAYFATCFNYSFDSTEETMIQNFIRQFNVIEIESKKAEFLFNTEDADMLSKIMKDITNFISIVATDADYTKTLEELKSDWEEFESHNLNSMKRKLHLRWRIGLSLGICHK